MRGIFFDEAAARAVVARLVGDGFDASLVRDRFAGEDDDEDHPWEVRSDAPDIVLELLVDEYDGWLDTEEQAPAPAIPPLGMDLPSAPMRLKRPDGPTRPDGPVRPAGPTRPGGPSRPAGPLR